MPNSSNTKFEPMKISKELMVLIQNRIDELEHCNTKSEKGNLNEREISFNSEKKIKIQHVMRAAYKCSNHFTNCKLDENGHHFIRYCCKKINKVLGQI